MAEIKQWVNLPKTQAYANASKQHLDDLGERRVSVILQKRIAVTTGKLCPTGEHPYSSEEEARNPRFRKPQPTWTKGYVASGIENSVETFALPAAGGAKYEAKVKYKLEEKTSSDTLVAWRMIFVQSYVMPGMTSSKHETVMARIQGVLRDSFVELQLADDRRTLDQLSILGGEEALALVPLTPSLGPVNDHLVRVLWAYYLPDEGEHEVEQTLSPTPAPNAPYSFAGRTLTVILTKSVFTELEDNERPWVFEATLLLDPGLLSPTVRVEIERAHIRAENSVVGTASPPKAAVVARHEDRRRLVIDLHDPRYDALFNHLAGTPGKTLSKAKLKLRLRAVEGFSGGWSIRGRGVTVVATLGHWVKDDDSLGAILLHELGHFLGMVANGKKLAPTAPPHYYTKKGHVGPHCSSGVLPRGTLQFAGARARSSGFFKTYWSGAPQCVMFGATAATDGPGVVRPIPEHFCDECKPVVKKLDLSAEALKHVHET